MTESEMKAHRAACSLVMAHLLSAARLWSGQELDPGHVLKMAHRSVDAIRNWAPETIARALAEIGATP